MIRLVLTAFLLLSGTSLASSDVHKDARPLLDNLLRNYAKINGCRVRFERTMAVNEDENVATTHGTIEAVKPNRFRVVEGDVTFVSDGETMWTIRKGRDTQSRPAPENFRQSNGLLTSSGQASIASPAGLVMTLLSGQAESALLEDMRQIKLGPPRGSRHMPTLVMETREGGSLPADTKIQLEIGLHHDHPWVDTMTITPRSGTGRTTIKFRDWHKDDRSAEAFRPNVLPGLDDTPVEPDDDGLEITPAAKVIVDRVKAYYASIPGASVTFTMVFDMSDMPKLPGMEDMERIDIEIVKPNLFRVTGMTPISMQSNGTFLWDYSKMTKSWSRRTAPRTMKQSAEMAFMTGLIPGLIMDTFAGGLAQTMLFEESTAIDAAPGRQSGMVELVITSDDSIGPGPMPTLSIGVSEDGPAWLQYVRMELPDTPEAAPPGPKTITFNSENWKVSDAPAVDFNWTPPTDWKKVDDLMSEIMQSVGGGPIGEEGAQTESIGKPAPDFTLESLDGQTVSLASLKGKTVILDFWATWCGPCRQGLPILMEIAESRASEGVVLWTVDLREQPKKVRAFLEKSKWDLPVLMDTKGEVAMKYGVGGIPHTVVIGPDGTIVTVEIGFAGAALTRKAIDMAIDKAIGAAGS